MRKYVVFHWLYWTLLNPRGQSWSTASTSIQLPSHPYPCEGERTERPEQPVSALSEFWWRLCFSTRPHGSITFFFLSLFCCPSPCSAVKESGEKKLEGSPKQWLFSQEDRTLYSLSCALCPSDTVISSMSGKGKQSPFPVPTHVCYTSNGTGTVACPLSQLSQTRAAPISEMSCWNLA